MFVSRIRMEQLMSITQEETENLRRREIACESRVGGTGSWEQGLSDWGQRVDCLLSVRTAGAECVSLREAAKSRPGAWALVSGRRRNKPVTSGALLVPNCSEPLCSSL